MVNVLIHDILLILVVYLLYTRSIRTNSALCQVGFWSSKRSLYEIAGGSD